MRAYRLVPPVMAQTRKAKRAFCDPSYLVKQLGYFQSQLRANVPVMHAVTDKMTFEQMEAVAAYAASK